LSVLVSFCFLSSSFGIIFRAGNICREGSKFLIN
jgi:hypothetical protein